VELLCNRVMIIDRGRIVAEGTPESLRESQVGNPAVRVLLKDAPEGAGDALATLPGALTARAGSTAGAWIVEHERSIDLREAVFRAAVQHGWVLLEMGRERATLEDIFVRLTTRDAAAGTVEEAPIAAVEEAPAPAETPTEEEPS
jgi:ABC-2 type transport system ATP-binding protein